LSFFLSSFTRTKDKKKGKDKKRVRRRLREGLYERIRKGRERKSIRRVRIKIIVYPSELLL
jgi:hypothetical protein